MKYLLSFLLFFTTYCFSTAQELAFKVTVNASSLNTKKLGGSIDKAVFGQIELAVSNFLNNQRWSTDAFTNKEKIKCNLTINLLKSDAINQFSGSAILQVIRPVYGSTYESVVLQYFDQSFDFNFAPEERQMLFNEQSYTSNLTSMLAFYSLLALTADYDSFSKLGGNPYLERAFNITNLAGNASTSNPWVRKANSNARYWMIENYRSQQFNSFREGFYEYHRLVLDDFAKDPIVSRKKVTEYLEIIGTISSLRTNSILLNSFFDAKGPEILNIFSQAPKPERQKIFNLLNSLDPGKSENYRILLK
jgi:Domain of unknown function (DUF4835)